MAMTEQRASAIRHELTQRLALIAAHSQRRIDRKSLAELAVNHPEAFAKVAEQAKAAQPATATKSNKGTRAPRSVTA